ncbi:MAG: CBS domain-containing protein [Candidatus Fonsibacter ubiquis]|nr:CBS domain-containing protein [Candidatus Fonsibacter ubiquis]
MIHNQKIKFAKEVIFQEINALKKLSKSYNSNFIKAIDLIQKCKGKVICVGMGKSGHIIRKISATLSSVGVPSIYLHPSEAAHGDLGACNPKQDCFLIMSYSGNTDELKSILNYAHKFKMPIIGVASKENSTLISMLLAWGDSVAITLMKLNKFSKEKFAVYHPSGALGKQLTRVKDIMIKKRDVPFINENMSVKNAVIQITKKTYGCVLVLNKSKKVTGIITDGDIRRSIHKKNFLDKTAKEVMTKNPKMISENTLAGLALDIMNKKKITSLIIKGKNNNYGLIHIHSLISFGV